jgi:hypothetical protein
MVWANDILLVPIYFLFVIEFVVNPAHGRRKKSADFSEKVKFRVSDGFSGKIIHKRIGTNKN